VWHRVAVVVAAVTTRERIYCQFKIFSYNLGIAFILFTHYLLRFYSMLIIFEQICRLITVFNVKKD